jgi:hypothetical protein
MEFLGGASSDVVRVVFFDEFRINGKVFFFGKDRVVQADRIFFEEGCWHVGGDIEKGISHTH